MQNDAVKDAIMGCAEEVKSLFDASNEHDRNKMKEGLTLYRQGNVYNVTIDNSFIEGMVTDSVVYDVTIDLDSLDTSLCGCLEGGFCVHQLALFFSAYAGVDRVGNFLEDWKSTKPIRIPMRAENVKKHSDGYDEQSLSSWLAFFEDQYIKFKRNHGVGDQYFASYIFHRYFFELKAKAPKAKELKRLYNIHAAITAFVKITAEAEHFTTRKYFDLASYVRTYLQQLIDAIAAELKPIQSTIMPFSLDPLVEESLEHVRIVLQKNDQFILERIGFYQTFWSSANFPQKSLWKVEKEKLIKLRAEDQKNAVLYHLALCHLAFIEKEDEKAIALMKDLTPIPLHFCMNWMNMLANSNEWDRLSKWYSFVGPQMNGYIDELNDTRNKRSITRAFLHSLELYAEYGGGKDEYVDALEMLLPYSFSEYSDYLFDTKSFRKWTELQLLIGTDVSEFSNKDVIKVIEQHDRACLLPLYHYAVTNAINERNRQSYKLAVRYLKKLRIHYRKLKKEPQWDAYITRLVEVNKRLRAFLEEARKGKLIDV